MEFFRYLYYIILAVSLMAVIINRKRLPASFILFIPLLLLALFVEGASYFLPGNNIVAKLLFSIYTPVEYLLLSLLIASFLNSPVKRTIIFISIPVFMIAALYIQFALRHSTDFYKYLDVLIVSPLMILWSVLYFFQLANDEKAPLINNNPMFWVCVGNLLFFSGSFFSYGFGSYLATVGEREHTVTLYDFAKGFNLALYFFYTLAFLCPTKTYSY